MKIILFVLSYKAQKFENVHEIIPDWASEGSKENIEQKLCTSKKLKKKHVSGDVENI